MNAGQTSGSVSAYRGGLAGVDVADDHDVDVRLLLLAGGSSVLPSRERAIAMSKPATVITYPILAVVLRCCGKVEQATCA